LSENLYKEEPASASMPDNDKRRDTYYPATFDSADDIPTGHHHGRFFTFFRLGDIFSSRFHTKDFKDSRADYINTRLRYMAFFFAVAVPLYIPVDYYTLSAEHLTPIILVRCIIGLLQVLVCLLTLRVKTLQEVNYLLAADILLAGLFYMTVMYLLGSGVGEEPSVGYTFMPLMIIAMLGLFPMTLVSSFLTMLLVVVPYLLLQGLFGRLVTLETFDMVFLMMLFMGIVFWLQTGQLLMLLNLYRESTRDALTGLINRRVLMRFLADEVLQNRDKGRRFSILILDLDRFKHINDDHGHLTGDLVLKATARLLESELRLSDIVARFGGEEFVAVLPGLAREEAVKVAERICKVCSETQVSGPDGSEVRFTSSIGVTEYRSGEGIEATLRRADDALYDAKERGRNRVIYIPA